MIIEFDDREPMEVDTDLKDEIEDMSLTELCTIWRFGGRDELTSGDAGKYFSFILFDVHGGFTPEISKAIGWEQ